MRFSVSITFLLNEFPKHSLHYYILVLKLVKINQKKVTINGTEYTYDYGTDNFMNAMRFRINGRVEVLNPGLQVFRVTKTTFLSQ